VKQAFATQGRSFNTPLDVLLPLSRSFLFFFRITHADDLKRASIVELMLVENLSSSQPNFNPTNKAAQETFYETETNHRSWTFQLRRMTMISCAVIELNFTIQAQVHANANVDNPFVLPSEAAVNSSVAYLRTFLDSCDLLKATTTATASSATEMSAVTGAAQLAETFMIDIAENSFRALRAVLLAAASSSRAGNKK
jgi:hypothetical protein